MRASSASGSTVVLHNAGQGLERVRDCASAAVLAVRSISTLLIASFTQPCAVHAANITYHQPSLVPGPGPHKGCTRKTRLAPGTTCLHQQSMCKHLVSAPTTICWRPRLQVQAGTGACCSRVTKHRQDPYNLVWTDQTMLHKTHVQRRQSAAGRHRYHLIRWIQLSCRCCVRLCNHLLLLLLFKPHRLQEAICCKALQLWPPQGLLRHIPVLVYAGHQCFQGTEVCFRPAKTPPAVHMYKHACSCKPSAEQHKVPNTQS